MNDSAAQNPTNVHVQVIGELQVRRDGSSVKLPPSRKTRAVLAYLVLTGRVHRRERLCEMFWEIPDDPRASLRWTLTKIRQIMNDPEHERVKADRDHVSLDLSDVAVDLDVSNSLLDTVPATWGENELKAIARLTDGDVLEGLELSRTPEFDAWLMAEREQARTGQIALLRGCLDRPSLSSDWVGIFASNLARLSIEDIDVKQIIANRREPDGPIFRESAGARSSVPRDLPAGAAGIGIPSIAVLPFENLNNSVDFQHICDGISGDMISLLTRYKSLRVSARNSSFSYRARTADIRTISAELDVRYLVEGSVRCSQDQLGIAVNLIDAENGSMIWSERFNEKFRSLFEIQDDIARLVCAAVMPEIGQAERARAQRKAPAMLDAWEHYQLGLQSLYQFTLGGLQAAQKNIELAIQGDPQFAAAHAALAYAIVQEIMYSEPSDVRGLLDRAEAEAELAVRLDDHDAFGYFVLGRVHILQRRLDVACLEFNKAIDLNPTFAYAYFGLGIALLDMAKYELSLEQFKIAERLSPRDPHAWAFVHYQAWPLIGLGRYETALERERIALTSPNAGFWPYIPLIAAQGYLNRTDEAKADIDKLNSILPGYTCARAKAHLINAVNPLTDTVLQGLSKAGLK